MSLPLQHRRICVTRPADQAGPLASLLEEQGAEVLGLPLIETVPTRDRAVLAEILEQPGIYDWIVFTSANGVRHFFQALHEETGDLRSIAFARLASVGTTTSRALRELYLRVELQPEEANAEALGQALVATGSLDSARVLVVTGNRNGPELPRILDQEGHAIVDTVPVYETRTRPVASLPETATFREQGADAILFTSGSAVESFVDQIEHLQPGPAARLARAFSIGASTSRVMEEQGIPLAAEAPEATLESLVATVARHLA
jgi:uroporphyrinogen-III synthase